MEPIPSSGAPRGEANSVEPKQPQRGEATSTPNSGSNSEQVIWCQHQPYAHQDRKFPNLPQRWTTGTTDRRNQKPVPRSATTAPLGRGNRRSKARRGRRKLGLVHRTLRGPERHRNGPNRSPRSKQERRSHRSFVLVRSLSLSSPLPLASSGKERVLAWREHRAVEIKINLGRWLRRLRAIPTVWIHFQHKEAALTDGFFPRRNQIGIVLPTPISTVRSISTVRDTSRIRMGVRALSELGRAVFRVNPQLNCQQCDWIAKLNLPKYLFCKIYFSYRMRIKQIRLVDWKLIHLSRWYLLVIILSWNIFIYNNRS